MRHYKKGRKLGTDASHTAAIKKNLVVNLFLNDRIKTTLERAKEIRGDVDRVITWAKRGDVHSRRLAIAKLGDKQLVAEIFSKIEQGLFKDRPGGYSRIYKVGKRRGDDAIIVLMELVQEPVRFKKKSEKLDAGAKGGLKVAKKSQAAAKASALDEEAVTEEVAVEEAATEEVATDEVTAEAEDSLVDAAAEEAAAEATTKEAAVDEAAAQAEEAPAEEPAATVEPVAAEEPAATEEPATSDALADAEPADAESEA